VSDENQPYYDALGVAVILGYIFRGPIGKGMAIAVRWSAEKWTTIPEPMAIFVTRLADWLDPDMVDITGFDFEAEEEEE
jgi:hypothetical protein